MNSNISGYTFNIYCVDIYYAAYCQNTINSYYNFGWE